MHRRAPWSIPSVIGVIGLVAPTVTFADNFFNLDDLRQIADLLGRVPCESSCEHDKWSFRRVAFPSDRYAAEHPEEKLFLVTADKEQCGSAGCPAAYFILSPSSLIRIKEGFAVGRHPARMLSSAEIPGPSLRSNYAQVPLMPASGQAEGATSQAAGAPDLVPSEVKVTVQSITPGQAIRVSWTMTNIGDGRAKASATGLRLKPVGAVDGASDITLVREVPTPAIDAGRSIEMQGDVKSAAATPAGQYTVVVVADNSNPSTLGQKNSKNDYAQSSEVMVNCRGAISLGRPLVAAMKPVAGSGFVDPAYATTEAREHLGTDYQAVGGSCVYAMRDGTVEKNETASADPMAAVLIVKHTDGSKAFYGHIESARTVGSEVARGVLLGTVRRPTTAYPGFASHLHYGEWAPPTDQSLQDQKEYDKACLYTEKGTWGWGRAPLGTTSEQILKCGWVDAYAGEVYR